MNNPNRCETCIGEDRPEDNFDFADTGVCGVCGRTDEVWDVAHLAALLVQGKTIYADDGLTRIIRPLRNSFSPHQTVSKKGAE